MIKIVLTVSAQTRVAMSPGSQEDVWMLIARCVHWWTSLTKSLWWHLANYATHVSLLCWIWHHLLCSAWTLVKSLKNEGRFLSEHSVTYSAVPKADFDFLQMLASLSWSVHGWNTCSWREDGETCGVTCPSLPLLLGTTEITAASLLLSSSCVKGAFRTARANGHGIFSQRILKSRELTERFLSRAVKESRFKTLKIWTVWVVVLHLEQGLQIVLHEMHLSECGPGS